MTTHYDKLVLTETAFANLNEYSCSLPTMTTIGKRWKRFSGETWFIGEYLNPVNGIVEVKWWEPIILSEEEINQLVTSHDRDIEVLKSHIEILMEENQALKENAKLRECVLTTQFNEALIDNKTLSLELCGYKAEYADNKAWIITAKEKLTEQAETIKHLQNYLKPFVEQLSHERDHGRTGNPAGWCLKCELEAALVTETKL